MSIPVAVPIHMTGRHLEPRDVVAYVDRAAPPAERSRIEAHLASCSVCRAEVGEAAHIIAALPRDRRMRARALLTTAAVAAALLVFLVPHTDRHARRPQHREGPVTTTIAPVILTPVGAVELARNFAWSSVPHADRYELFVFDPDGAVIWQAETKDTVLIVPVTVSLRPGVAYYWKVQAHTGIERSTSTDLVEFSIRRSPPQ